MDSITHVVLGACMGEAIAGRRIGKRALFLGALAQSFPDIDFLGAFFLSTADNILAHRGLTHSFLFAISATLALAFLTARYFKKMNQPLSLWLLLFGANIFTHLLIDALNAYGTGWLEPFSQLRVSFHTVFVADPLFTLGPLAGCLALTWLKGNHSARRYCWQWGLGLSAAYLIWAVWAKLEVNKQVESSLSAQGLAGKKYFTTPAPFTTLLWFVAVSDSNGMYTAYRSVLDGNREINWQYHPQQNELLSAVKDQEELKKIRRFADGFYTVSRWNDTTALNVLRFGQVVGWYDPKERFVFHYLLDKPGGNLLVTQRGRFQRWNDTTIHALWQRMWGH